MKIGMKYLVFPFFIIQFFYVAGQNQWKIYKNENPEFSILVPGKVEQKEKIIITDIGETLINSIYSKSSTDSTDNYLYIINYYSIDRNLIFSDSFDIKQYMTNMANNICDKSKSKMIYSQYQDNSSYNSLIYRCENESIDQALKGKIIFHDDTIFSLQVFTTKQYSLNQNIDKFLNSFRLNL